jgi:hypothetical protein
MLPLPDDHPVFNRPNTPEAVQERLRELGALRATRRGFIPPDTPDSPTAGSATTPILQRWAAHLPDAELGRILAEMANNSHARHHRERYALLTEAARRLCEVEL